MIGGLFLCAHGAPTEVISICSREPKDLWLESKVRTDGERRRGLKLNKADGERSNQDGTRAKSQR
jgi:hypothetical protein